MTTIHTFDRVRATDPVTSVEAAASNDLKGSARYVFDLLRHFGPMADHELVMRAEHESYLYGDNITTYTPQRLRTARRELADAGVVRSAGIYRLTQSCRRALVWELVEGSSS